MHLPLIPLLGIHVPIRRASPTPVVPVPDRPARRLQYLKAAHKTVVDRHHRRGIVKFPAVVGRGKYRHELPSGEELVPVLDDLVRPHDEVKVMLAEELSDHISAEGERDPPVIFSPSIDGWI
ncbi:hypothetical protein THAOC_05322, partial [Thalassiosira oceanica]